MCGVKQTDVELVAHVGPGNFPNELNIEPFIRAEILVDRDQQCGRIAERNETNAQAFATHRSRSAAVMIDWAISTIFLFSFIAVLRISA